MSEPVWVDRRVVDAVHLDQLREHGGLQGVRDENALESALARARNKWAYESVTDPAALAAAYGYGIATGHPYRDGNKRIAFLTMVVFLGLNGWDLDAPQEEYGVEWEKYWGWFRDSFSPRIAMEAVEKVIADGGRIQWIDYRVPLPQQRPLHFHVCGRGQFDTAACPSAFAECRVRRMGTHGPY